MTYETRDTYGIYARYKGKPGPGPELMGAGSLIGEDVCNAQGESLGDIKEIMLDMRSGEVAYAVLSFGGFLTIGEKLFAVPWQALQLDTERKAFILQASRQQLENAPGFDRNDWPDMSNPAWAESINAFYSPFQ